MPVTRLHEGMLCLALVGALCAPAQASEDDRSLSASLSWGRWAAGDNSGDGAVLGGDYERGFSEMMSLRVSGGAGYYLGDSNSYSGHLTLGITYQFDVVKYVPYANLGVGGIVIGGSDRDTEVNGLFELGVGLDILRSRSFSYGVVMRFEALMEATAFFTIGLRATWRWGFF